ncbi:Uncharacterised protein [BD1-7 clade bacterium]|uniref:Uncharacterized protein n=1 Tax=BD1-7 clade bacterium TaxID=2029982 RepID=A0A5S9QMX6_9GAMM|nr:Uncharacterised protein [BD1-7 clade bacterium]CAA0119746.1 Uncharacterised protein [BD1-7 clade bacterium]
MILKGRYMQSRRQTGHRLLRSLSVVTLFGVAALSVQASAENWLCSHTNTNDQRTINIIYHNPPSHVPCEVVYTKAGTTTTLWRANNQSGYCENKAAAFVAKQKGWGWQCRERSSTPPAQ